MRDSRSFFTPTFSFPLVALALLFGLFLTGCDEAVLGPTLRGSIEGRVLTFENGTPVAGASVTTSPATGAFVTDGEGRFTIADVESGPYNLSVRKSGFRANTLSVAVRDDETTPATLFLERDEDAAQRDSVAAEIVNWANRVVNDDGTGRDSVFVDVEYRVRNAGTTDVGAYEVYVRIETTGDSFFQEVRGETLPASQADIATFSKFIRTETARDVLVSDVWFEPVD
jgi:TolB protein